MSDIDEDRIRALEAHIILINKDLTRLSNYVEALMEPNSAKELKEYKDMMELCKTEMVKDVDKKVAEQEKYWNSISHNRLNKGE